MWFLHSVSFLHYFLICLCLPCAPTNTDTHSHLDSCLVTLFVLCPISSLSCLVKVAGRIHPPTIARQIRHRVCRSSMSRVLCPDLQCAVATQRQHSPTDGCALSRFPPSLFRSLELFRRLLMCSPTVRFFKQPPRCNRLQVRLPAH